MIFSSKGWLRQVRKPEGTHLGRKLRSLSREEWALLLWAQLALIRAQIAVWIKPRGRLIAKSSDCTDIADRNEAVLREVRKLNLAVERVAEHGVFRPKCLAKSLALVQMMQARGYQGGSVKVGVTNRRGKMEAHAWVEFGGAVLTDREWHVRHYEELDGAKVS